MGHVFSRSLARNGFPSISAARGKGIVLGQFVPSVLWEAWKAPGWGMEHRTLCTQDIKHNTHPPFRPPWWRFIGVDWLLIEVFVPESALSDER